MTPTIKLYFVVLSALAIVLLVLLFTQFRQTYQARKAYNLEIREHKRNIRAIVAARDSLQTTLAAIEVKLQAAYKDLTEAKSESQVAIKRSNQLIRKYEAVTFKPLPNDSARNRALSGLYSSHKSF